MCLDREMLELTEKQLSETSTEEEAQRLKFLLADPINTDQRLEEVVI